MLTLRKIFDRTNKIKGILENKNHINIKKGGGYYDKIRDYLWWNINRT